VAEKNIHSLAQKISSISITSAIYKGDFPVKAKYNSRNVDITEILISNVSFFFWMVWLKTNYNMLE
jgi:hypothetical protein